MTSAASLRAIPKDFDPDILSDIDRTLEAVIREEGIGIGLAIESGSRAWGFPSPDSDYDCRFVFVRREIDYLSPWQKRDVIELPIEDELDINGWELGKALKLLLKGNAVLIEWLMSPIVYSADNAFRSGLINLARRFSNRAGIARHYLHLGERQRRTYFGDGDIALKKLFYALRPAAALRWLRLHPNEIVAPMHFPTLIEQCDSPREVQDICVELMVRKAATRELGKAPLPKAIAEFVDSEFALAHTSFASQPILLRNDAREAADIFFRDMVKRFDGESIAVPASIADYDL